MAFSEIHPLQEAADQVAGAVTHIQNNSGVRNYFYTFKDIKITYKSLTFVEGRPSEVGGR